MALKRKIDKAAYDALPDVLKTEYKASGSDYLLDTDDAAELVAARDREKEARRLAEKEAKEAKEALDAMKDKTNRENGDIAALDKSYKEKLAAAEKRAEEAAAALEGERKDRYVSTEAERIAKRFTVPGLMRDQIAKRLQVEMADGKPLVRVLDKDGKLSAASVAEFEKELVDNPEYKGIVIASKASGSADTSKRPGGSAPNPTNHSDGNLAKMDTKSLLEHMKGVVDVTE